MANKVEIAALLFNRFGTVPSLTMDDANNVVDEMVLIFGLNEMDIPVADVSKLMSYASAELAMKIALNTAHYFKFTDGEESVDKSLVSENYRKLANDYRSQYDSMTKEENRKPKSTFKNTHRIDRPPFSW